MTAAWTESLIEELARPLRGGSWQRVEILRDGGFVALEDEGRESPSWQRVGPDGALSRIFPFEDALLPGLQPAVAAYLREGFAVRLLAHKIGRRAVLCVERDADRRIAKVHRRDRHLLARWQSVRGSARLGTPRVLRFDPALRLLEVEFLPGESLHQRFRRGAAAAEDGEWIAACLELLADQALREDLPAHRVEDEVELLRERHREFQRVLRQPPPQAPAALERVTAALAREADAPRAFCHRDFHDKQILRRDGSAALLDLDLVAVAPAALDAGNMLAHLHLRWLQGLAVPWRELARPLVAFAEARGLTSSLPVWTAATLLRLTFLYARRRRNADLLERLLEATQEALERRGEWAGLFAASRGPRCRSG